jgi:hypothetical protein
LVVMMGSLLLLSWSRLIHLIWVIRGYDTASESVPDIVASKTK